MKLLPTYVMKLLHDPIVTKSMEWTLEFRLQNIGHQVTCEIWLFGAKMDLNQSINQSTEQASKQAIK